MSSPAVISQSITSILSFPRSMYHFFSSMGIMTPPQEENAWQEEQTSMKRSSTTEASSLLVSRDVTGTMDAHTSIRNGKCIGSTFACSQSFIGHVSDTEGILMFLLLMLPLEELMKDMIFLIEDSPLSRIFSGNTIQSITFMDMSICTIPTKTPSLDFSKPGS